MVHLPGKYLGFDRLWRKLENKLMPKNTMRPLEYLILDVIFIMIYYTKRFSMKRSKLFIRFGKLF